MKGYHGMHRAQVSTLYTLRHVKTARFSELQESAGLTSDAYKFHIARLSQLGYVTKNPSGMYELTATGKEFANRLNTDTGRELIGPKASMLLIVCAQSDTATQYLVHQRKREPFYGYWGIGSAPVRRGISIEQCAADELKKQTGLEAKFAHKGLLRVIDKNPEGDVLEDKLFSLMYTTLAKPVQLADWKGGVSVWMSREEIFELSPLFPTTHQTISMIESGQMFREEACVYTEDEY